MGRRAPQPQVAEPLVEVLPRFEDLLGQDVAIGTLKKNLAAGRLAGAYLFVGPVGVGKFTAALALAGAANCAGGEGASDGGLFGGAPEPEPEPSGDACTQCASCRKIAAGNHPDVRVISKALRMAQEGKRIRDLTIEQVRPILHEQAFKPYEGHRRVIIVDGAHDLNAPAQNALLKSLEEPGPATTFVLVTDQPRRLLPTVISRSRIVRFGPVSPDKAAGHVAQALGVDEKQARDLLCVTGGSIGMALGPHNSLYSLDVREEAIRAILRGAVKGGTLLLETAEDMAKRGEELPATMTNLASFFRDARVLAADLSTDLVQPDMEHLSSVAGSAGTRGLDKCFQATLLARSELTHAAQDTRLVLEHLLWVIHENLAATLRNRGKSPGSRAEQR